MISEVLIRLGKTKVLLGLNLLVYYKSLLNAWGAIKLERWYMIIAKYWRLIKNSTGLILLTMLEARGT